MFINLGLKNSLLAYSLGHSVELEATCISKGISIRHHNHRHPKGKPSEMSKPSENLARKRKPTTEASDTNAPKNKRDKKTNEKSKKDKDKDDSKKQRKMTDIFSKL